MVGHTGVFDAVVKAVETTDACLEARSWSVPNHEGYAVVVIADHGNADLARNEDGSPHTAHTTNPVPVWVHGQPKSKHGERWHPGGRRPHSAGADGLESACRNDGASVGLNRSVNRTVLWSPSLLPKQGQLTGVFEPVGPDQDPLVHACWCRSCRCCSPLTTRARTRRCWWFHP